MKFEYIQTQIFDTFLSTLLSQILWMLMEIYNHTSASDADSLWEELNQTPSPPFGQHTCFIISVVMPSPLI